MKTLIIKDEVTQLDRALVLASLAREVRFLSYTRIRDHPNIIRLLGISWDIEMGLEQHGAACALQPIAVLEFADGTLNDYIEEGRGAISITTKASLIADIVNGLDALHSVGLVHSDMKPENILIMKEESLGRPVAKLGDFGESIQTSYPNPDDLKFTKCWKSPELHQILASSDNPEEPQSSNHASQHTVTDILDLDQELGSVMSSLDLQPDAQIVAQESITNDAPEIIPPLPTLTGFLAFDQKKFRDVFSTGLVAMYILIERLPFEDPSDYVEVRGEKKGCNGWTGVK